MPFYFRIGHVPCGNNPDFFVSNGKYGKKQTIYICPTEYVIAIFKLGMFTVPFYDQWFIKKNLLTFSGRSGMLIPILGNITLIPFETSAI